MRNSIPEETLAQMEKLWCQGARVSDIAEQFGVSERAVYTIAEAHRERFPSRRQGNWRGSLRAAPPASSTVYQWRHPEGAVINLPIVKGYVGEQAHG